MNNYTTKIFESKKEFHKKNCNLSFEEKIKQVIELQKIDIEFSKHKNDGKYRKVWEI